MKKVSTMFFACIFSVVISNFYAVFIDQLFMEILHENENMICELLGKAGAEIIFEQKECVHRPPMDFCTFASEIYKGRYSINMLHWSASSEKIKNRLFQWRDEQLRNIDLGYVLYVASITGNFSLLHYLKENYFLSDLMPRCLLYHNHHAQLPVQGVAHDTTAVTSYLIGWYTEKDKITNMFFAKALDAIAVCSIPLLKKICMYQGGVSTGFTVDQMQTLIHDSNYRASLISMSHVGSFQEMMQVVEFLGSIQKGQLDAEPYIQRINQGEWYFFAQTCSYQQGNYVSPQLITESSPPGNTTSELDITKLIDTFHDFNPMTTSRNSVFFKN